MIRDLPAIRQLADLPVFARGVTPIGPLHRGPGEINYPISVGGTVVHPGDVIVGDLNGVVVVPRESAVDLVERLASRAAIESEYVEAVARGEFSNRWVDEILGEAGVDSGPNA
jgi:regulator of RNase E activity RraA